MCQISLGVESGARLDHTCIKHNLNILLILFDHIYMYDIFICIRQCFCYASNSKPWLIPIVGPWADYWGNSWHVSPWRYKKRAHGRILGDFLHEPADLRVGAFTGIAGMLILPVVCALINVIYYV